MKLFITLVASALFSDCSAIEIQSHTRSHHKHGHRRAASNGKWIPERYATGDDD